ncbi:MAG: hypothetical protein K2U26_19575, partial [Cyclobacteriaceae bacterium]|nr:hypothetical protein [Cyclobacteriaceae bacterium]
MWRFFLSPRIFGVIVLLCLTSAAFAQNTKGDRPVNNQRQVRETKVKSVKRKEKARTRDIANRRLRTKDKSSANRANASYPQPSPYQNRVKSKSDRAAAPRGRVFSQSPRESRVRAWKGDVSGYPIKRMKPTNSDAARNNVFPQKGPYVRYARKQPEKKPPVYSRTIKGTRFVKREPRYQERAWKGGVDRGPIKNQSATGTIKNTYSQKGPYVRYKRKLNRTDRPESNKWELSTIKELSRKPLTGSGGPQYAPPSASRPFVQRGRKNVYWGKFQRKERGVTTDLTGGPLRTRNYRSMPAGLIGRDTIKFFGRKPLGDRSSRASGGGFKTATRRGQQGWKGDIAGWPLRKPSGKKFQPQGALPPGQPGIGGTWISRTFNRKFKGVKPGRAGGGSISGAQWNNRGAPIGGRTPGAGSIRGARYQGNVRSYGKTKVFGDQGTGYSGNLKRWRLPAPNMSYAGYSGNERRYGKTKVFSDQGMGNYRGNLKRWRLPSPNMSYAGYSGNLKRWQLSSYTKQGAGYSGNIRSYGKKIYDDQGIGNYRGNLKRWQLPTYTKQGAGYSGNIRSYGKKIYDNQGIGNYRGNLKRWQMSTYTKQGAGYSGNIRSYGKKIYDDQGIGNYRGNMKRWQMSTFDMSYAGYSGNVKRWSLTSRTKQGAGFAGNLKQKRPEKGGGSVSGKLWNNNEKPIPGRTPLGDDAKKAGYSGNIKFKRPEKGGGSV